MARILASLRRAPRRRPILDDRRGAVIVEFALVAAPLITLIFAMIFASLAYLAQEALESAVEISARSIMTGQSQSSDIQGLSQGMTRAQLAERFRKKGCENLPGFMSCDRLYVEVKAASSGNGLLDSAVQLVIDASGKIGVPLSYDLGSQGAIVMVRFYYRWPMPIAPTANLNSWGSGSAVLVATSVAKTESYN